MRFMHRKIESKAAYACLAVSAVLFLRLPIFAGETVTVDNVVSLTNELDRLNRLNSAAGKNLGDTIILKKGEYDVSSCRMLCDSAETKYQMSTSHLAIARVTLRGETDNPRDTVIYGDRSERILYMFEGNVHDLTISNGCRSVGNVGGGGVCARNQVSTLSNVVVTCCSAKGNGGGAYYVNLCDCTVEKCTSDGGGGGVYYSYKVLGGKILGNYAKTGGGGACNSYLNDVLVAGNTTDGDGGGLKWNMGECAVKCRFVGNTAKSGGGLSSVTNVYDCLISNNVAVTGGGVADSMVRKSEIVHNLARALSFGDAVKGGGCYGTGAGKCKVYDSLVAGNACALEVSGTTITGGGGETVYFYGSTIRDNFSKVGASLHGGLAEDCIISNNVTPSYYHNIRITKSLTRCQISKESLTSPGALTSCVVKDYDGRWELPSGANVYTNGVFENPNPSGDTYRLFVNNASGVFSLTNCLIYGNKVYSILNKDKSGTRVNVVNCTIADNTNSCMFAGFAVQKDGSVSELCLKNTIICRNKYFANPANDWNFWPQYGKAEENNIYLENCLIGTGGWLEGQQFKSCEGLILENDPKFMLGRGDGHPYSLKFVSPARGKGTLEDWMLGSYDIRNDADGGKYLRVREGKVDLGAYQCWLEPAGMAISIR